MKHVPVLLEEVLLNFKPKGSDRLLDATLGLGGHTAAYLEAAGEGAGAVGIEADPAALAQARENLDRFTGQVIFIRDTFARLGVALTETKVPAGFSHILFDLGIGSHQLADPARGFSFESESALTMRYGTEIELPPADVQALNAVTQRLNRYPDAWEIIKHTDQAQLAEILRVYGEERYAGRIARALQESLSTATAKEVARVVAEAVPASYEHGRINPATRTFQALRLAVNRELESLRRALPQALEALSPGGMLAVISFHSLEDRIVKRFMKQEEKGCICPPRQPICTCGKKPSLGIMTKKPVLPSEKEIEQNPRSRSAKLRIAVKLE